MVLVAVDDLLFSSKIRTTAKQAGVDVTFVRTPAEIVEQVRARRPPLVIVDLNCEKCAPIETIAAIKSDPDLASTRAIGFVSHVDAVLIDAARRAGADDVMARSAFAGSLAEILLAGTRS